MRNVEEMGRYLRDDDGAMLRNETPSLAALELILVEYCIIQTSWYDCLYLSFLG